MASPNVRAERALVAIPLFAGVALWFSDLSRSTGVICLISGFLVLAHSVARRKLASSATRAIDIALIVYLAAVALLGISTFIYATFLTENSLGSPSSVSAESMAPRLVGLTEAEAKRIGASVGLLVRTVSRDGQELPIYWDLNSNRINIVVLNNLVRSAEIY